MSMLATVAHKATGKTQEAPHTTTMKVTLKDGKLAAFSFGREDAEKLDAMFSELFSNLCRVSDLRCVLARARSLYPPNTIETVQDAEELDALLTSAEGVGILHGANDLNELENRVAALVAYKNLELNAAEDATPAEEGIPVTESTGCQAAKTEDSSR